MHVIKFKDDENNYILLKTRNLQILVLYSLFRNFHFSSDDLSVVETGWLKYLSLINVDSIATSPKFLFWEKVLSL